MGEERLIEILNELVAVEIAAVTEYQQHAYLSDDPYVIELLEDFSMDEMSHIEWCSREVARLGGMPTVIPKEIKHVEKTFQELVKRDIGVEAEAIKRMVHPDANIIFGAVIDSEMKDQVQITVIATGFRGTAQHRRPVDTSSKIREFPARTFDSDDLSIPAFMRQRRPKTQDQSGG